VSIGRQQPTPDRPAEVARLEGLGAEVTADREKWGVRWT